ncbi:MAG: hypothetical protein JW716_03385 [Candidatus Aenigmarchaeota archaeon]|nr:hypothetical protein [Candidatus Aenigmarchaeota archaeon]
MNVNLIFAIIFAIIVMIVVIFFAAGQFSDLFEIQNQATFYNQVTEFDKTVNRVADMSMGSTQQFEFNMPSQISKVCFIDRNNPESNPPGNWETTNIIEAMITDNDYNLFIYDEKKGIPEGKKINYLIPRENFCISSSKTLWIENKGRYVTITE